MTFEENVKKLIASGKYDKQLFKVNRKIDKIIEKHSDIPRDKVIQIIKDYDDLVFMALKDEFSDI